MKKIILMGSLLISTISLASTATGELLLANSQTIEKTIYNASAPHFWAVNQRKGLQGTITTLDIANSVVNEINALSIVPAGNTNLPLDSIVVVGQITFGAGAGQSLVAAYSPSGGVPGTQSNYITFDASGIGSVNFLQCVVPNALGGYYVGGEIVTPGAGFIARLAHGALDTTFGTQGIFKPAGFSLVTGLANQSTGATVYVGQTGTTAFGVNRLTPSGGTNDTSFTQFTGATMVARGVAIDSQDRIIVAGSPAAGMYVYRLLPNGAIDPSFNGGTFFLYNTGIARAVTVLADDSILVVGDDGGTPRKFRVVKLTSAGVLDSSFGGGTGVVNITVVNGGDNIGLGVTVFPSGLGRFAVTGNANNHIGTLLFNSDGTLNQYFTIPGQVGVAGAGTAQVIIPNGTQAAAWGIGYQAGISDTGLVVAGLGNNLTDLAMIFYTDADAGI